MASRRQTILAQLDANRRRRAAAAAEIFAARDELETLLRDGHAAELSAADLADAAGLSRDTVYRTIKEESQMTWKDRQAWATALLREIRRGDFEDNQYRMIVNGMLMKALGKDPGDVPRSVAGILDEATRMMRELGKPGFEPRYDQAIRATPWPV
ncbi:MAG TPA: hypothetical protein VH063_12020 [Gaiellaceae bacterium]|nr:hypothetical protein [Gaiellaceae bacterium]